MKHRYIFTILLVVLSLSVLNGQGWRKAVTPTETSVSNVFFLYSNIGWFVGNAGLMKKTDDGGVTWTTVTTGVTEDLKSVHFVNNNLGYIGSQTKIYKTTNGGNSWTPITVTGTVASSSNLNAIYFADEQKGWALSSSSSVGKVLQTIDGGTTWTVGIDNPAGDLEAMDFYSPTAGIVVGGGVGKCDLWYTKDGSTWTKATAPTFPAGYTRTDVKAINMLDQNIAFATGWGSLIGAQASIYLKTYDGGVTWTYLTQADQNKTFDNMYGIYFKDEQNGLSIGGAIKGSVMSKTSDGGTNWVPIGFPSGATLSNIYGFGNNVIVATSSGSFFSSPDFGATWNLLTPFPSASLYSISAVNNNVIYAAGYDGLIVKSTDGGKTWKSSFAAANKVCPNIQGAYFVNENIGYLAQSYGAISKTTNGGVSWFQVKPDVTDNALITYGAHFVNADLGFVVGKKATNVDVIYKTVDGGANWTEKNTIVSATLRGVAFADAQKGVVVGEKLKAAYTIDGGNTWTLSTFSGVPTASASANLREVAFLNSSTVVAVGDKVILLSTNGGASFTYVNFTLGELLTGVAFNSATNGWAVGAKSASPRTLGLFQTSDGGSTWTNKVDYTVFDVNNTINDVSVSPNGYVYVCAGSSAIYTNSPLTDVEDENDLPITFSLSQNYPNPFNPSTSIRYSIKEASFVTLKVYDILGSEVSTLVNEFQQPGSYNSQFSILNSQLSSGIYFYQLKAGNYSETRKMLYLK
jgi:photosystem II stability/assembly factor-like uncharacterized protein